MKRGGGFRSPLSLLLSSAGPGALSSSCQQGSLKRHLRLSGRAASERPCLEGEAAWQGEAAFARSASAGLQESPPDHRTRRNPENRDLQVSSWGPPHDEAFRAT